MWEAFEHAGYDELDNLTAIIDVNRLGQRGETMHGWDLDALRRARCEAFGWHAIEIDGHDVEAIDAAYARGRGDERPADRDRRPHDQGQGRHSRSRTRTASTASRSTTPRRRSRSSAAMRDIAVERRRSRSAASRTASRPTARRAAALRARRRGRDPQGLRRRARRRSAARAATSSRSTARSRTRPTPSSSRDAHPERFFEMFIAEQQMVAAAVGMQVRGWKPFASTFAAFLTPRLRLRPHGGDLAAPTSAALRLARRRLDRRGRPVADGARGPRLDARGPRLDRALPVRRQPDGAARAPRWPTARASRYLRTTRAARRRCSTAPDEDVPDRRQPRRVRDGDDVAIVAARDHRCTRRSRRPRRSPARASRRA